MTTKTLTLLLTVLILFTSCGTIFTGTKDAISFNSSPSGAMIYKDGVELCRTPCRTRIKRSLSDVDIEFKLDNYQTRIITLDKEFNTVSIINLGFLLGWGIDALTGSLMKYDRKAYDIELTKDNKTSFLLPEKVNIDTKTNVVEVYVKSKN